ncbi:MAG TPA: hypothetical protein VF622_09755 [Segetibacter sp.]|jgi:hypothetical protein
MCQFSLPLQGDPQSLLRRAESEIVSKGGAFNGDSSQGNFRAKTPIGSIEGAYQILESEIALTITKKPLLLSCRKIEKELRSVMN